MKKMSRWKQGDPAVLLAVAIVVMAAGLSGAGPRNFKPDGTFKGSALTGWRTLGDAEWKAQNGEIVGTAKPGTAGGWLVMDKAFQDVRLFANYRCTGECRSGVLLRAQTTPDGGMRGVYISVDRRRVRLLLRHTRCAGPRGCAGASRAACRTWGRRWRRTRNSASRDPARDAAAPPAAAATRLLRRKPVRGATDRDSAAAAVAVVVVVVAAARRPPLKAGDWNPLEIILALASVRSTFGGNAAVDEANVAGYGSVALYVGGTGEVRYKDVAWKDLNCVRPTQGGVVAAVHGAADQQPLLRLVGAATGDINR